MLLSRVIGLRLLTECVQPGPVLGGVDLAPGEAVGQDLLRPAACADRGPHHQPPRRATRRITVAMTTIQSRIQSGANHGHAPQLSCINGNALIVDSLRLRNYSSAYY